MFIINPKPKCLHLRRGEGQDLNRRALGGHGVVDIGGEGDTAACAAAQDGWWCGSSGGDGDELAFTPLTELV